MVWKVECNDSLEWLKTLEAVSADSMVTDPPAGIAFGGEDWDKALHGIDFWSNWLMAIMEQAHRVLKPGAHGLVWSFPRTSHWTAMALENAGFEIRTQIMHLFGTAMPTSHNLKDEWKGWGTVLKPFHEVWWLVRKPLKGTVKENMEKHGTGAINIDGCRVRYEEGDDLKGKVIKVRNNGLIFGGKSFNESSTKASPEGIPANPIGRWPPTVVASHSVYCTETHCDMLCPIPMLDQQSGIKTSVVSKSYKPAYEGKSVTNFIRGHSGPHNQHGGTGGASRFIPNFRYMAKPSPKEKDAGLQKGENNHKTVKPIELMRWLCRLITRPRGLVIDPFLGTGTTGCGAVLEGFDFLGCDKEQKFVDLAKKRIEYWSSQQVEGGVKLAVKDILGRKEDSEQFDLF